MAFVGEGLGDFLYLFYALLRSHCGTGSSISSSELLDAVKASFDFRICMTIKYFQISDIIYYSLADIRHNCSLAPFS